MSGNQLTAEQLQMVKIVHENAMRFPVTEAGDAQILQTCYDYMDAFKRVLDSTDTAQMDYICHHYSGFYRFAKLMERLATAISNGDIEVQKDH